MTLSLVLQINYIELKCINHCCLFNFISNIPQVFGLLNTDIVYSLRLLATIFLEICMKVQFFLLFQ